MDEKETLSQLKSTPDLPNGSCIISIETKKEIIKVLEEKQSAKSPVQQGCYDKQGVFHPWNGINGKPYFLCPSCGTNLCCEMPGDKKPPYCSQCGQKLDWEEAMRT